MIYGTVIHGESKVDGSETRRIILIRLMQQKGLSNKKLAELSGLDKVSISRYRTGKSKKP